MRYASIWVKVIACVYGVCLLVVIMYTNYCTAVQNKVSIHLCKIIATLSFQGKCCKLCCGIDQTIRVNSRILEGNSSFLRKRAECSSKLLMLAYQNTRSHAPQNCIFDRHDRESLKSRFGGQAYFRVLFFCGPDLSQMSSCQQKTEYVLHYFADMLRTIFHTSLRKIADLIMHMNLTANTCDQPVEITGVPTFRRCELLL